GMIIEPADGAPSADRSSMDQCIARKSGRLQLMSFKFQKGGGGLVRYPWHDAQQTKLAIFRIGRLVDGSVVTPIGQTSRPASTARRSVWQNSSSCFRRRSAIVSSLPLSRTARSISTWVASEIDSIVASCH